MKSVAESVPKLSALHPAADIIRHLESKGLVVRELLAFTRRSTILLVDRGNQDLDIIKVFFGSDHVLDAMDPVTRQQAYGFYWYASKTDAERRFEVEAVATELEITQLVSGLPGWPTVLDAGELGNLKYMCLKRVIGQKLSLPYVTERKGISDRLNWLGQVAAALHLLHEKGIVHRDVYHENILVSEGSATIIDLGCAQFRGVPCGPATRGPEIHWPPEYMADYASATAAADIFGLGVMLHRTLTGDIPRAHSSELLAATTEAMLREVVLACLSPDAGTRPRAGEVAKALLAIR